MILFLIKNFKGNISEVYSNKNKKYIVKGVYNKISDSKLQITELPLGIWTDDYKEFLEGLIDKKKDQKNYIKDYSDNSTEKHVDITIEFCCGVLNELLCKQIDISGNIPEKVSELEKYLKLYTTFTTSNMHLFDQEDHLNKYENIQEIIDNYYELRLKYYVKRKEHQLLQLENELIIISNKARFINMNITDEIDLRKKKNDEINEIMARLKFDKDIDKIKDNYHYLTKMPMDSVSEENVEKLMKEKVIKKKN